MLHSAGEEMSQSFCSYVLLNVFLKESNCKCSPPQNHPRKSEIYFC